jgi:23S rRNA (uridine2552-2'-O)-methyltransferase
MPRTKSSKAWLHRHVTDPYVHRAQAQGYRARSAYKLLQINERDRLLKLGMLVVDLGAAPGGWSQVAAQAVGAPDRDARGRVVAVDLLEMAPLPGVRAIQGDFGDAAVLQTLRAALRGEAADLVLSDMAPNISGIALSDQARSIGLAELALDFALAHLKPGGALLVKLFQGEGFDAFVAGSRQHFAKVVVRKPDASRAHSSEVYLLGTGKR